MALETMRKYNGLHPEAEKCRDEFSRKKGSKAIVVVDFKTPLSGDASSHLVHEATKQGLFGFGHPLEYVLNDVMSIPDLPTRTGETRSRLGDAALASTKIITEEK